MQYYYTHYGKQLAQQPLAIPSSTPSEPASIHALLNRYRLQIVRHPQLAREIPLPLRRIPRFPLGQIAVLRVVQQQVAHMQPLRQLAGVFDGRVVLLIRPEDVRLRVQAKRLMQEPRTIIRVLLTVGATRLVAATGQLFSPVELHAEPELLCLGGVDVKEGHPAPVDDALLAVDHGDELQAVTDESRLLGHQQLVRQPAEERDHLVVRVDVCLTLVNPLVHGLAYHPHHPDDAQQVVDVLVRHEDLPHAHPIKARRPQLAEHAIPAAAIDHEQSATVIDHEAGVVALRRKRVSRAEHRDVHTALPSHSPSCASSLTRRRQLHLSPSLPFDSPSHYLIIPTPPTIGVIASRWDMRTNSAQQSRTLFAVGISAVITAPPPSRIKALMLMSKPSSGLFRNTSGEESFYGDAESIVADRAKSLDLNPHPIMRKELSAKKRKAIKAKIINRTATREEYQAYMWDKRFGNRKNAGIQDFWAQEADRILSGKEPTRNWSPENRLAILEGRRPKWKGKRIETHHTYAARLYPHLANRGEILYPATHLEHLKGWHGGNYRNSLPGRRIKKISE